MKLFTNELKWGVIYFACSLIWIFIEKYLGYHDEKIQYHPLFSMIFGLVALCVFFLAIWNKKRTTYKNNMSWKQGFISGLILTIVIAIFAPFEQFLKHNIISPDFLSAMKSVMVSQNRMSAENADAYFDFGNMVTQSVFSRFSTGVVLAALVSLILRTSAKPKI